MGKKSVTVSLCRNIWKRTSLWCWRVSWMIGRLVKIGSLIMESPISNSSLPILGNPEFRYYCSIASWSHVQVLFFFFLIPLLVYGLLPLQWNNSVEWWVYLSLLICHDGLFGVHSSFSIPLYTKHSFKMTKKYEVLNMLFCFCFVVLLVKVTKWSM